MTNNYNEADRFDGKGIGRVFADEPPTEAPGRILDAITHSFYELAGAIGEPQARALISSRYEELSDKYLL